MWSILEEIERDKVAGRVGQRGRERGGKEERGVTKKDREIYEVFKALDRGDWSGIGGRKR